VLGPHSAPEGRLRPSSLQSGEGGLRHHSIMVVLPNARGCRRLCSGLAMSEPPAHAARDGNGSVSLIFCISFMSQAMPWRMVFASSS